MWKSIIIMETNEIITYVLTALGGGGITQFFNWRANKKKANSEVSAMEIDNIKAIVDSVYQPLIEQQNKRIKELELEVKELREERTRLNDEHQKEIAKLQKQILDITRALGLKATNHVRNSKGQFTKADELDEKA